VQKLSVVSKISRSFHCTELPIIRLFSIPLFTVSASEGGSSNAVAAKIIEGTFFIFIEFLRAVGLLNAR
jgi:hypothetical protein